MLASLSIEPNKSQMAETHENQPPLDSVWHFRKHRLACLPNVDEKQHTFGTVGQASLLAC